MSTENMKRQGTTTSRTASMSTEAEVVPASLKSKNLPAKVVLQDKSSDNSTESEYNEGLPFLNSQIDNDAERKSKKSGSAKKASSLFGKSVYNDDVADMTYSRRIAEKLMKYSWYYPHNDPPNERLVHAWEYFEHTVLPRYINWEAISGVEQPKLLFLDRIRGWFTGSSFDFERARSHDKNPTKLYPSYGLGLNQMHGFGIGIFLYFSMLKYMIGITLFAGLMNISTIRYFGKNCLVLIISSLKLFISMAGSSAYDDTISNNIPLLLQRSAICKKQIWVPCKNCSASNYTHVESYRWGTAHVDYFNITENDPNYGIRYRGNATNTIYSPAILSNGTNQTIQNSTNQTLLREELFFSLKNDCGRDFFRQGMSTLCTLSMIVIAILIMNQELKHAAVVFDEEEQTAQDYSIVINNPPFDAYDPEEW